MLRHLLEVQGRALRRLNRAGEAAEQFRPAIDLDPSDSLLWLQLARCLEDANCYRTSLELGPELWASVAARLELGEITR